MWVYNYTILWMIIVDYVDYNNEIVDDYGNEVPKMDGLQGKIRRKWMMTGGTPIFGNPHMEGFQNLGKFDLDLTVLPKPGNHGKRGGKHSA